MRKKVGNDDKINKNKVNNIKNNLGIDPKIINYDNKSSVNNNIRNSNNKNEINDYITIDNNNKIKDKDFIESNTFIKKI